MKRRGSARSARVFCTLVGSAGLGLALPASGVAASPVSLTGTIAAQRTVLRGTVAHARSSWRVRGEERVSRVAGRTTRSTWVTRVVSASIPRSGRFQVSYPASGTAATVRAVVIDRKGHRVRVSRAIVVRAAAAPTTGPGPVPPSSPAVSTPAAPATTPSAPATGAAAPAAAAPRTTLSSGETLAVGQSLVSPSGRYTFTEQADGNLVLYDGSRALWSTGARGSGATTTMQSDGNLVTMSGGAARWSSGTDGFAGARLVLQDDGNLVVYVRDRPIWTVGSGYLGNTMLSSSTLQPGDVLRSPDHRYSVIMQPSDGNLVLYGPSGAVWSTAPNGAGASVGMQSDGNLVVRRSGTATWASGTDGFSGAILVLQDDGNLVVYQNGHPVWTWGSGYVGDTLNGGVTLGPGAYLLSADHRYQLLEQPSDGNLVLYGPGPSAVWAYDTAGHPGARSIMQTDGNFVVYDGGVAVRNTGTGTPGSFLRVQNDANVVIYKDGRALWSRATGPIGGSGSQGGADPGNDYPSKWRDIPQDSVLDDWREYNRECTSFVAWALSSRNGFTMPFYDDATNWGPRARALGYAVNGTPALGAVAWASSGHVAYVQAVSGGNVFVEEYNRDYHGNYSSRWVAASSFQYIHFRDR